MNNLRICNEINNLKKDPPIGISLSINDNLVNWNAIILGPEDSPWEGGIFELKINIPEEYPHKPPNIKFLTPMFHPNIYRDGKICIDILQDKWSPVFDIRTILLSLQSLLTDPNIDSPANTEASNLYKNNKKEYNRKIRKLVENM